MSGMRKEEALEQLPLLEEMEKLIVEYQELLREVMEEMTNLKNDGCN